MVDRRIIVGGSVVAFAAAGIFIYRYEKKKSTSAAAATAQASAASAYGYGAQTAYGYGAYPGGYYGYGAGGGYYGYGTGSNYGYGTPYPGPSQPAQPATTNAQWVQASVNQLQGEGYNPMTVSAALGAYIAGQSVSAQQRTIIQAAIALEGYPPDSGASGYPPGIKSQGTPGGGQGGGQGGGGSKAQVIVPNVVGDRADDARKALRQADLSYNISDKRQGVVASQNPKAGTRVKSESEVSLTIKR